jgi:hypothetical protein
MADGSWPIRTHHRYPRTDRSGKATATLSSKVILNVGFGSLAAAPFADGRGCFTLQSGHERSTTARQLRATSRHRLGQCEFSRGSARRLRDYSRRKIGDQARSNRHRNAGPEAFRRRRTDERSDPARSNDCVDRRPHRSRLRICSAGPHQNLSSSFSGVFAT